MHLKRERTVDLLVAAVYSTLHRKNEHSAPNESDVDTKKECEH